MLKFNSKNILLLFVILFLNCALTNREDDFHIEDTTVDIDSPKETQQKPTVEFTQKGKASFMADEMHGKKTASGEIFDMRALTAAHKYLPFGTIVRVTNLVNSYSVKVKINDRGPFVKDRIIDVSFEAAKQLDFVNEGITNVKIDVIKLGQ